MQKTYTADKCSPISNALENGWLELNAISKKGYPGKHLNEKHMPSLCTIGTWDIKDNQKFGLDWHRNEGLEITFTLSGNLKFHTKQHTQELKSNMLTLTRPWQSHKLGNPLMSANKLFWIILDLKTLQPNHKWIWPDWVCLQKNDLIEFEKSVSSTTQNVWQANHKIENIVLQIDKFIKNYTPKSSLSLLSVKINELILESLNILKAQPAKKNINPTRYTVELFLEDIIDNPKFFQKKITIDEMAKICATNQTNFFNLCKKITNKTPANYINFAKVNYAIKLMQSSPNLSLTKISQECGFDTSQYFSTVFKHFMKISPVSFKKNLSLKK